MTVVENEISIEQSHTNKSYIENTSHERILEVTGKQSIISDTKDKGEDSKESGLKATNIIKQETGGWQLVIRKKKKKKTNVVPSGGETASKNTAIRYTAATSTQSTKPKEEGIESVLQSDVKKVTEASTIRKPEEADHQLSKSEEVKKAPKTRSRRICCIIKRPPREPDEVIQEPDKAVVEQSQIGNGTKTTPSRKQEAADEHTTPEVNLEKTPDVASDEESQIKVTPDRSKSNFKVQAKRKGRPRTIRKDSPARPNKLKIKRKQDSRNKSPCSPLEKKKIGEAVKSGRNKTKRRGKNRRRKVNQDQKVGVQGGRIKYRLAPADFNAKQRQRIHPRGGIRRKRGKPRRKNDFGKYGGNYWEVPQLGFCDLSSIECGSYADKVDICAGEDVDFKDKVKKKQLKNARRLKWGNKRGKRNDRLSTHPNFAFNPSALEYIPPEHTKQIRRVKFTLNELLESVKGQELPVMPSLAPFYRSRITTLAT